MVFAVPVANTLPSLAGAGVYTSVLLFMPVSTVSGVEQTRAQVWDAVQVPAEVQVRVCDEDRMFDVSRKPDPHGTEATVFNLALPALIVGR